MKKTFKFPVYEVYDLQREINRKAFETVTEAKEYIIEIDKIQSEWYAGVPRGPFRHHRFIISEAIYTTVVQDVVGLPVHRGGNQLQPKVGT